MKQLKLLPLFILVIFATIHSQNKVEEINSKFESFEYEVVIDLADVYLKEFEFSEDDLTRIYTMKGVAHYSLSQTNEARKSFLEMLKIDRTVELDPAKISPKIISFFEELKRDVSIFFDNREDEDVNKIDTLSIDLTSNAIEKNSIEFRNSMMRSIVLPGWGHLYSGDDTKGIIISVLGTAALGSMIYFINDTNTKEENYLNQTDPELISEKYDDFNSSFKTRNSIIFAYAAIWVYSQLDLMFFSNEDLFNNSSVVFYPSLEKNVSLSLNVSLPF